MDKIMKDLKITDRLTVCKPDKDGDVEFEIETSDFRVSSYVDKKDIPKLIEYLQKCL